MAARGQALVVEILGDSTQLQKVFKKTSKEADTFGRNVQSRGLSIGKSFASAFSVGLGGAAIGAALRGAIREGTEQAVAQRQLQAQFKASGQNLALYQDQITATINKLSLLAGIEDDEVLSAFTLSFRATQNVTQGLRLVSIAADVAKARHISLAQATLALNKAYGGNVGALRRLGITIPNTLKGMQALEFVGKRFAGQAAAGTTAQDRFNVAFRNLEQAIGTALLPTFNKYVNALAAWLGDADNQKKVQEDVTTVVNIAASGFEKLAEAIQITVGAYRDLKGVLDRLPGGTGWSLQDLVGHLPGGNKSLLEILGLRGGGGPKVNAISSQGAREQPGRSPGGAAAFLALTGASGGIPAAQRNGLRQQFLRSTLALAKAQTTATQADDRRVLVEQKRIIQAAIRLTTNLKKRRDLYNQLAGIQNQIAGIDQKAQDAADTAAEKAKNARQKALEAAQRRAAAEKAQHQKELALLKAREDRLRSQIKAIQGRFQDQLDIARQGIGDLFAGPVKADVNEAARRTLGLSGALALTAGKVIGDVLAQTAQSKKFQNEVNRIVKGSGLTKAGRQQLRTELTAAGVGSMANLEAVLSGGPGAIRRFGQAFAAREKQAAKIATVNMKSQLVVLTTDKIRLENLKQDIVIHHTTNLDGRRVAANTSKYQARAQRRTATQKTGRIVGLGPVVG